ncbi:LemA family protein [Candidatus Viridilinea mediisalina]|uniref:LemA family protein n=1 Tax=Candidatus Viridilinea mediisalina TaxID=2024553 RepID=A0A2A6RKC9_9CHLR|nr:LemA family protein [Candidatus Viridilinea mediisalina]PDW03320.1 LemA family protein [Candidatus Viridilinea mediisalina]
MEVLLIFFVIVVVVVLVFVIGIYNGLVGRRNRVDQAFASIDVMLKKRYDLVPNLIATVERYMVHERELLTEVTELRTRALAGDLPPEQRVAAENGFNAAMGRLMVSVENYPDLKSNTNFLQLQRSLNEVEEQISAARRAYNAATTDYNNAIQMFPGSLFAGPMGFTRRELFEASMAERQNVDVRSMFQR